MTTSTRDPNWKEQVRQAIQEELEQLQQEQHKQAVALAIRALELFDIPSHLGNVLTINETNKEEYTTALYIRGQDADRLAKLLLRLAGHDLLDDNNPDTITSKPEQP